MKKVMFIMTKLGGTGWGGAHKVSVMLANHLARHGYDVSFSVSELGRVDYPIDNTIKIFCLTDLYQQTGVRGFNLFKKMMAFRKLCKKEKIDIVVGFTSNMAIYSIFAGIFSKRKALVSERTDPHIEPRSKILRGARNLIFCLADFVVFQTPGAREYYPKVVRNKSTIIPNPISDTLPEPYTGQRTKRIVNFCRIAPQKNLKVLLDAFAYFCEKYDDYSLEIYGDAKEGDSYKEEVTNYAADLACRDKIHFYPACSDVHQKVRDARMFASSSDYEGMSNSMLEAMSIGLPTIVTDCANGGERMCIASGENGYIVPLRDAQALCDAMLELAGDEAKVNTVSENAVKIRERFSGQKVFDAWKDVIEKM